MASTTESSDGVLNGKTSLAENAKSRIEQDGNEREPTDGDLKVNGGQNDDEETAMDCDAGDERISRDGEKAKNGSAEADGEDDDDDDLSSDIGLIEDDEDLDEMTDKAEARARASLERGSDVEMQEEGSSSSPEEAKGG